MTKSLISLLLLPLTFSPLVTAGGAAWCTWAESGDGPSNPIWTKKCCELPKWNQTHQFFSAPDYFLEGRPHEATMKKIKAKSNVCVGKPGGYISNRVDHGEFAICCMHEGGGSRGVKAGVRVYAPV